ncbi:MAG: hypothetical protein AAFP86_09465, partial [Planctomycetota bacterium]
MKPLLALLIAPALLGAAPAAAQDSASSALLPEGLDAGRLAELSRALLVDEPGDGRTWARGATYKASFGAEGFTYRPFLGSDVPRSYPLELDLGSVTLDGAPLELGGRERSRAGRAVTLDRGTAREVYHLSEESVEQTFVFDALPGRGELVLELDVETDLAPRPDGPGFAFECAHGAVNYGGATAVDARGRTLALAQRLDGDVLRIVVPAAFVRSAALPLVVDPILSTFSVTNDVRRQTQVDVAYSGNATNYQIVYAEADSGVDFDVLSVFYSASLDVLFPPESIDISATPWTSPSNAYSFNEDAFLCAAVVGNGIGNRRVRGRILDAVTADSTAQFDISGPGAETVDVGGYGGIFASNHDFMVVWQESDTINADMDIVAQAVNGNGSLTGSRIVIDGDVGDFDRNPAISKASGRSNGTLASQEYMIVWEREISPTNHDLRCQVIGWNGAMAGHPQFSGYTFSDALDPCVSMWSNVRGLTTVERHWVIAFERRTGTDYDIFAVVARDGEADNAKSLTAMQDLDLQLDHRDPQIAFDSQDFLVTYQTERANGDRSIELTALNVFEDDTEFRSALALRRETLGTYPGGAPFTAIASHWAGGGPELGGEPGDALVAFQSRATAGDVAEIAGSIVAETSAPSAGPQYCGANPHSGGT